MLKFERTLSIKNLRRKPVRTAALVLLTALLSISVFGGSLITMSLRRGLASYGDRLGADIVAVPYEARTKGTFESILVQGIPGTFYMDEKYYRKIADIEGVETAAPQFYLASTSSGCCSVAVQIIGFDPELDFTVLPWIRDSFADEIGVGDIIVGSELTVPVDGTLTFYNTKCRIVARLDRTGTGLDTAVYANMDTIAQIIENAQALGFTIFDDADPYGSVSSVMIRVADGYDVEKVTGDINIHVRHIVAQRSTDMLSGIAEGLSGVSRIIGIMIVMIWILAVIILIVAFSMICHERVKEFAVLRVMGASVNMLFSLLLTESVCISAAGSLSGLILSAAVLLPFGRRIGQALDLPYLLPQAETIAALALGAFCLSILAGLLAAGLSAARLNKNDAGISLREGA